MSTAVRHALAAIVVTHVVYLSVDKLTLFSLHPACMTIGSLIMMSEAIVSLTKKEVFPALRGFNRVTVHWCLQVLSQTFLLTGFVSIWLVKNQYGKPHYASWHGTFGLWSILSCLGAGFGGVATLYAVKMQNLIPPSRLKFVHGFFGTVAFSLSIVAHIGGLRSDWFIAGAGEAASAIHVLFVAAVAYGTVRIALKNVIARL